MKFTLTHTQNGITASLTLQVSPDVYAPPVQGLPLDDESWRGRQEVVAEALDQAVVQTNRLLREAMQGLEIHLLNRFSSELQEHFEKVMAAVDVRDTTEVSDSIG